MEWLFDPTAWVGLFTLVILEIVLGIDNLIFIAILGYDAWTAMWWPVGTNTLTPGAPREFGIGVGTLILTANVVFIALYTFGCHSLRHLVGGVRDVMSGRPVTQTAYRCSRGLSSPSRCRSCGCRPRGHSPHRRRNSLSTRHRRRSRCGR